MAVRAEHNACAGQGGDRAAGEFPKPLCLHGVYRPRQLDALVYLCNAGSDALAEVTAAIDTISMRRFYTLKPGERWAEVDHIHEDRWDDVPPGTCVLVNALSHSEWDQVSRYRLTFTDAPERRWTAQANDLPLNACQLAQNPERVWVAFDPE